MANLKVADDQREFWVWVDPSDWLARHNMTFTGAFVSSPSPLGSPTLMFLPNPAFKTFIAPFQNNLIRNYIAEYNLELARAASFPTYPCRLECVFLVESEEDAERYAGQHPKHVAGRVLKRVRTNGDYKYSVHDASWVDFMRSGHSMDKDTLDAIGRAYWSGQRVEDCELQSMGKPWMRPYCPEVLFSGRVDFYDRDFDASNAELPNPNVECRQRLLTLSISTTRATMRTMSAEARARISAAQKARWTKQKGEQTAGGADATGAKPKRGSGSRKKK